MKKFFGIIREFVEENMLMLAGMSLMLASAGVDGYFLSRWMTPGFEWMGYVLNLVSDASTYILSNMFARFQSDPNPRKRRMSYVILAGEAIGICYAWLFTFLVLRMRLAVFFTIPVFGNLRNEIEILAAICAGFVPSLLAFAGYADALQSASLRPAAHARKDAQCKREARANDAQAAAHARKPAPQPAEPARMRNASGATSRRSAPVDAQAREPADAPAQPARQSAPAKTHAQRKRANGGGDDETDTQAAQPADASGAGVRLRTASIADWRAIAAGLDGERANLRASDVEAAVRGAGLAPPSRRTAQTWARKTREGSL